MSSILPTLGKDVSIDIGSIQTRLMGGTRGTVISEPSIIATDTKQEKVVAVGDEAAHARYVASVNAFKGWIYR